MYRNVWKIFIRLWYEVFVAGWQIFAYSANLDGGCKKPAVAGIKKPALVAGLLKSLVALVTRLFLLVCPYQNQAV